MKLIILVLYFVTFNVIHSRINPSINFENPTIFTTTKILLTILTNGENLGNALRIVFENQDLPFEQTNPNHVCQLAQTEKITLNCLSSNDNQGRWVLDITTVTGELKGFNNYEITIDEVQTPFQAGKINITFSYWEGGNPISFPDWISFLGLNTPTIKVKLANPTLGINTNYNYEIEVNTAMNINLDIYLLFPMYNQDDYASSFFSQFGNSDPNFKLKLMDLKGLNPSSHLDVPDKTIIRIINAFPNGIEANVKFSFTLQNILSPAEITKKNFRFELRDSRDFINQFQTYSISIEKPGHILFSNLSLSKSRINTLTEFTISFKTEEFKPANTVVDIIFPDENYIKRISDNMMFATGKINLDGDFPIQKLINDKLNSNCYGLRISELFRNIYAEKHLTHSFLAYGLQTPKSTKPVNLSLLINNSLFQVLYAETENFTIKATPGEINNIQITLADSLINKKGSITISLRILDAILINGKIEITLPEGLKITPFAKTNCLMPVEGIQTTSQCQADEHTFTITKLSQLEIDANIFIKFSIPNVSNPSKCIKMSSVILRTKTDDDYTIDESTDENIIQITPGLFKVVELMIPNKTNYKITNYEFKLQTANPIEANGGFVFIFPKEIGLSSTFYCTVEYNCTRDDQTVKVKPFSKQAIPALTIINITFYNMINPRSLKTSDPIEIYTVSSDDYMIDTNDKKTIVTNSDQIILTTAKVALNAYNTYAELLLTFTVTITVPLIHKDQLILNIPIDYPYTTAAKVLTVYGTGKLTSLITIKKTEEIIDATRLYLSLTFHQENDIINPDEVLTFQLNGLRNPVSLKSLTSFSYSFLTEDGFNIMKTQGNMIPTLTSSQFNSITILPASNIMNSIENYNIVLKTYIPLMTNDFLIIVYPIEIIPQNDDCSYVLEEYPGITIKSCIHTKADRTYKIQFAVDNTKSQEQPLKITFNDWKSEIPVGKSETTTFKVSTKTSLEFTKEENKSDIIITFKCLFPCEKCTDDKSFCTKCYASGIDRYLLNGKCYSKCPDSYSENDIDNTCVKCNETCKKCIIAEPLKCTLCSELFPYYNKDTFECLTSCPNKTYPDDKMICQNCATTCATCVTSANNCLTCVKEFPYIYDNKCHVECPSKTVEASNKICVDCDTSCKTCINTPTTCSSCNAPSLLLKNQCVNKDQCSPDLNLFPDFDNNKCLECQEGCKICGNKVTECLKCDIGYIQKGTKCHKIVDSCPDGFFLTTEIICQECNKSMCYLCEQTPTTCTKCNQGLFLEQSKCVSQCSKGFYLDKVLLQCFMCNDLCETCSSQDICLSCKPNLVLMGNKCITESECLEMSGYYVLNGNCNKCSFRNCDQCTAVKCTTCSLGFYLFDSICLGNCPGNYIKDEASRTCIKNNIIISIPKENLKLKYVFDYPFDYMILLAFSLLPIVFFAVFKLCYSRLYYLACCIAFITPFLFVSNIFLIIHSFYSGEVPYFYSIGLFFLCNRLISCCFSMVYVFYISKDPEFEYWKSSKPFISTLYYILIHLIDYKLIRFLYSRIGTADMFNAIFVSFNKIHTPYRIMAVIELSIVYIPLAVICSIIVANYKEYTLLYYAGLENLIIVVILIVYMTIDLIINHDLNLDYFNQKKPKPDIIPNEIANVNNDKPAASFRFDLSEIGSEINQGNPSNINLNVNMKESKISGCTDLKMMEFSSIQCPSLNKGNGSTIQDKAMISNRDQRSELGKESDNNDYSQVECNPATTDRIMSKGLDINRKTPEQSPVRKDITFTNLNPTHIISFGNSKAMKEASFKKEIIGSKVTKENDDKKDKDFKVHDFGQLQNENQDSLSSNN